MDKIELELYRLQYDVNKAVITGDNAALARAQYEQKLYRDNLLHHISCIGDWRLMKLLYCRYIKGMKWCVISDELGYENRYIYKLRRKALEALRRVECNEKTAVEY